MTLMFVLFVTQREHCTDLITIVAPKATIGIVLPVLLSILVLMVIACRLITINVFVEKPMRYTVQYVAKAVNTMTNKPIAVLQ